MFKRYSVKMNEAGDGTGNGEGGTGGTGGAPAAAPAAPTGFDWATAGIDAEGLGVVQAKGWKAPADLLGSYRNLEKLIGAPPDKVVKLPDQMTPENMAAVWDKLGRPKEAAGYKIPVPEGQSGDFAKVAADWFHKAGLSEWQAQQLATMNNEYIAGQVKAQTEAYQQTVEADTLKLKTEWGAKHDANLTVAREAAKAFGVTAEQVAALEKVMGFAGVHRMFHNIGARLGEAEFHAAGGKPGAFEGTTPEMAQQQILSLRKDKTFAEKFNSADPVVRSEARATMKRLHDIAYPTA